MTQETPSLQVRCTSCSTSFKMKLKRGRIPTSNVPCPKCKSPIDLSTYTEADLQTSDTSSEISKRLRPAAELLRTIIPQAQIFDRKRQRKPSVPGKAPSTFHIQKGGVSDEVIVPKPTGSVVGRISTDLENTKPVRMDNDESSDLLDSGVLVHTPESTEIVVPAVVEPTTMDQLDAPSDPSVEELNLADGVEEAPAPPSLPEVPSIPSLPTAGALSDTPPSEDGPANEPTLEPTSAEPSDAAPAVQEEVVASEHVEEPSAPQRPKLGPPANLALPKLAPPNLVPPPSVTSNRPDSAIQGLKLPKPISGLSQSAKLKRPAVQDDSNSKVELSDALRDAIRHNTPGAGTKPDASIEIIRSAAFEGVEQDQAESFFKSSVEVAQSLEFEIEEFDYSQDSRAQFPIFPAIIIILAIVAAVVVFITVS